MGCGCLFLYKFCELSKEMRSTARGTEERGQPYIYGKWGQIGPVCDQAGCGGEEAGADGGAMIIIYEMYRKIS